MLNFTSLRCGHGFTSRIKSVEMRQNEAGNQRLWRSKQKQKSTSFEALIKKIPALCGSNTKVIYTTLFLSPFARIGMFKFCHKYKHIHLFSVRASFSVQCFDSERPKCRPETPGFISVYLMLASLAIPHTLP